MFAGRNASCTHIVMSSTRVAGTACSMGQATGTAAAIAIKKGILPEDVNEHIDLLQQKLLYDDAFIPWTEQKMPQVTKDAELSASSGNPEPVRNGINRPIGSNKHCWECKKGDWISYSFKQEIFVKKVTLILDSGLNELISMSHLQKDNQLTKLPDTMPENFRIEIKTSGRWKTFKRIEKNNQRLFRCDVNQNTKAIRFILGKTYGPKNSCVYLFYCE
jgi:hypothetical protein